MARARHEASKRHLLVVVSSCALLGLSLFVCGVLRYETLEQEVVPVQRARVVSNPKNYRKAPSPALVSQKTLNSRKPGVYSWRASAGDEDLLHRALEDDDIGWSARVQNTSDAELLNKTWLVNLDFWEKLVGSRAAFAKLVAFVEFNLPEFALVEPNFQSRKSTRLVTQRQTERDDHRDLLPARHVFNLSRLHQESSVLFVPSDVARNNQTRIGQMRIVKFLYSMATPYVLDEYYRVNCSAERLAAASPWIRESSTPVDFVCVHAKVFKDRRLAEVFGHILAGVNRVIFANFDTRVSWRRPGGADPYVAIHNAWHATASRLRDELMGSGTGYIGVSFRAGKFVHHRQEVRIAACARRIFRAADHEMERRNLSLAVAGLDVVGQGEAGNHRSAVLKVLLDELGDRHQVFTAGRPNTHEDYHIQDSVPGKAVLDMLLMAKATAWIGSGAQSGFTRLILQLRRYQQSGWESSTTEMYCMKDSHWHGHHEVDSGGD